MIIEIQSGQFINKLMHVIDDFAPQYAWFYKEIISTGHTDIEKLNEVRDFLSNIYVEGLSNEGDELVENIYSVGDVVAGFGAFINDDSDSED
jgi:hypothetical protein